MAPASTSSLQIVMTEITCDANGNPKVLWSQAYNGASALSAGSTVTLPTGLAGANLSYVLVQTSYQFLLPMGYAFSHNLALTSSLYIQPRSSNSIPCTGC